jgi:hypothetical protein
MRFRIFHRHPNLTGVRERCDRAEGVRIRQVSEDRATIVIECEDDSVFDVTIVDPGNSVSVRDKNDVVEYLG